MGQDALNDKKRGRNIIQLGIGQKIYVVVTVLVAIALIMATSIYVLVSQITVSTQTLAQENLPQIINSSTLNKQSAVLVSNARLLVRSETKQGVNEVVAILSDVLINLEESINNLNLSNEESAVLFEEIASISEFVPKLASNTKKRLDLLERIETKMSAAKKLHDKLVKEASPFYDDAEFNLMISIGDITDLGKIITLDDANKIKNIVMIDDSKGRGVSVKDTPTVDMQASGKELDANVAILANTLKYISEINLLSGYYNTAEQLMSKESLVPLREVYTTASSKIANALKMIDSDDVRSNTKKFLAVGSGKDGVFSLRESYLINTLSAETMSNELVLILKSMQENVAEKTSVIKENAQLSGANAIELSNNIQGIIIGASVLLLVMGMSISVFYVRPAIVKRVLAIYEATTRIADGDLDTKIEQTGNDELTKIAEALVTFKDNILENRKLEEAQKAAKLEQEQNRKDAMLMMADQFETQVGEIVEEVANAAQEMQVMTERLSDIIQSTSERSDLVSAAANKATDNVQTVAAATEEMSASIKEISFNVTDTVATAQKCSDSARESQEKLDELRNAVEDISAVVQSINDVAEQTNLLALNATIEAARAGDAGKGFAVVANEVKALANQTHNMTEEISNKVNHVKDSAQATIVTVNDIQHQITSMDEKTTSVAAAIEEQNATTTEISRSIQEAAKGTDSVSQNIQDIQKATTESASSTKQLSDASNKLNEQTINLQESVKAFIKEIRAT
ncbi:MAG: hypothetical protein COA45_04695 [Zetaproteobacteria bacterium]|nr:MAG: hypothetical protein COA45_04695 [Zetaproteobacteria bacterium]